MAVDLQKIHQRLFAAVKKRYFDKTPQAAQKLCDSIWNKLKDEFHPRKQRTELANAAEKKIADLLRDLPATRIKQNRSIASFFARQKVKVETSNTKSLDVSTSSVATASETSKITVAKECHETKEISHRQAFDHDPLCSPKLQDKAENNDSDDEIRPCKKRKVPHVVSSEEDEIGAPAPKKSRNYKAHAEEACRIRLASLQITIAKLNQSKDRGLLTESGKVELREAEKGVKRETKMLQKLITNKKAAKKYRKKKEEAIKKILNTNPEATLLLHGAPGRPRLNNEEEIIKTISEIAMFGSSADERRRSEIIRTCRTLDDLHKKLTNIGFEISRSATYLRLIPRKSTSLEGKRHVKTAPVRLIRAQEDFHKSHPDTAFCVASIRKLECLASLLSEDTSFISQDDKARVPIGLAAANKQSPFLMHVDYLVRLPDHSFVVGPAHKLIPSVYAGCKIHPTNPIGEPNGVSYTGPTFIAIRSGKHASSTAATHAQDFKRLLTLDSFQSILKTVSGEVKPILIFTVDGGPDENPRYRKVIAHAVRHFLDHNLDYLAVACNAPGRSAFNRVERRMAPLSHQLAGLILPHDRFGSHLDTQRRTTDFDLEKKNFQFAGETLAEVWSEVIIDGESVVAEYISPDETLPDSEVNHPREWYDKHVKESQYMLQISKCLNPACCSKSRSKLRTILPDGFLPPPLLLTSNLEAATLLKEDASFCPLYLQLALKVEVPLGDFKKIPYDFYCPSLQDELMQRCCSNCGNYFATQITMKQHKKSVHGRQIQVPITIEDTINDRSTLRRSARILGRRGNEVLQIVNDRVTGQALDVEWAEAVGEADSVEEPGEADQESQDSRPNVIQNLEEWLKSPWENIK